MKEEFNHTEEFGSPIGICNRTGTFVYETPVKGYSAYCPELDEDLYLFEFTYLADRL